MIAALYVQRGGVYFGLDGVDPWDEQRDARLYAGPWPVVAHPPCERWGRYATGGPMLARTPRAKIKGDDGGCFRAALAAVRTWGGVLEHPEASSAWSAFGLLLPPKCGGWTSCVEQGHYGHRARKATWLYAVTPSLPSLQWGASEAKIRIDEGFHNADERRRATRTGAVQRMSKNERTATPIQFRDVLLSLARSVRHTRAA